MAGLGPGTGRHGETFTYGTPVTDVLAWLLEDASGGRPYVELLGAGIWSRIGAEHDASLSFDPAGTPVCGGGLAVTTATWPASASCWPTTGGSVMTRWSLRR